MKMVIRILLLIFLVIENDVFAQEEINSQDSKIVTYDENGTIRRIKFDDEPSLETYKTPTSSDELFNAILSVEEPNTFLLKSKTERKDGSYYEGYRQYLDSIKVEGGIYILHFRNGKIEEANGHLVKISEINISPKLTPEQACKYYSDYLGLNNLKMPDFHYAMVISEFEVINGIIKSYYTRLCYKIELVDSTFLGGKIGYIDANTGEVLKIINNYEFFTAQGSFYTLYSGNMNRNTTKTQFYNNVYNLCDSSRGAVIHTWNLDSTYYTEYDNNRSEFTDNDNTWTVYENAPDSDYVAQDIHWALQEIYDYFYDNHNYFSSFDGDNHFIDAYAHALVEYTPTPDNSCYASFVDGYEAFFFGDGRAVNKPLGSLDMVAHEYAHGITANFAVLGDSDEEKSIKEGLSDIWGVIIENAVETNDQDKDCWKIGEEVILVTGKDCKRNIKDPQSSSANTLLAKTYGDNVYIEGTEYAKSGVMSYWFNLLTEGGADTNYNDDDYLVYGLGIDEAAEIVFEGQTGHFANVDNYSEAREAMINAAESACIGSGLEAMQVANAWYAVGVGSEPLQMSIAGNSTVCKYGTKFQIENLPSGCTVAWSCESRMHLSSSTGASIVVFADQSGTGGWVKATVSSSYSSVDVEYNDITINASTPAISGSAVICSSGTTFTLSASCAYDSIKWTKDSDLNITAGQGTLSCTFAATGNGASKVYATIYVNGDSTRYSKNVWVGKPEFSSVSGPSPSYIDDGCTGQPYTFSAYPARDALSQSSYQWMVEPSDYDWDIQSQYYDWVTIAFNDPYEYYQVIARATNACGATSWVYKNVSITDCYRYSMYPNPASEYVTITLTEDESVKTEEVPSNILVQITDKSGINLYSATKSGDSFTIPVSNLKDGNYIVSIIYDGKIENLPLIIKR